jgi:hypothetical protein
VLHNKMVLPRYPLRYFVVVISQLYEQSSM